MTQHNIPLGKILGIQIGLDYSWFVIFALLTWMLAGSYYPDEFKNWSPLLYWLMGAVTAIMLFVSVLLHELGHSVIALRYRIPVRSITLFLFGGIAQIEGEPASAGAEFLIAIAGPLVSLALAAFFYVMQGLISGVEPLLGLAKYLGVHQFRLGTVQPDTRVSARWWSGLASHRVGDHRKHDPVDRHCSKRRPVFCFLAYLCRYLANVSG
jgi:Zn-dependent protease